MGPLHRFDSCSVLPKHIGWERGIQQGSPALPLSNTEGEEPRSPPFTATPLTATPFLSAQLLGALLMAAHCERFSHNFNLMSSQSWGKKEEFTTFVKRKCPNNAENSMYDCFKHQARHHTKPAHRVPATPTLSSDFPHFKIITILSINFVIRIHLW